MSAINMMSTHGNESSSFRFLEHMLEKGISGLDHPIADGSLRRFKIEGDRRGSKNGWYVLHEGNPAGGAFGSWKTDEQYTWCSKSRDQMSPGERREYALKLKQIREQARLDKIKAQSEASQECQGLWAKANDTVCANHNYILQKKIKPKGIKQLGENLLVPIRDPDGKLVSLQFIGAGGEKRFKSGGKISGCYFSLGINESETIYICEGYATGITIYSATECSVVVAFNAGNLKLAAESIRKKYPNRSLVIAADNDHVKETNTGLIKARETADALSISLVYPTFTQGQDGSDFNDFAALSNLGVVKAALTSFKRPESPKHTSSFSDRFKILDTGVWFLDDNDEHLFICSRLNISAITRDQQGQSFGRLLEWFDVDNVQHSWAMPMNLLAGDGLDLRKELLDGGLPHISSSPKSKKALMDYISAANITTRARCVEKTGWHDECFVLPDSVIGDQTGERVILQSADSGSNHFRQAGTLEQWQQHVARFCVGNSRLAFAVSIAFAAPLLDMICADGGGFNFKGSSSEGKTTALKMAVSVCGGADYYQTWRATGNALEGISANHNDALLALDEMGQVDPKEAGETAYMLANGQGKARAGRSGNTRPRKHWRILFLSTSEISLGDHLMSVGKVVKVGQEVRLVDIPMNTGVHGGFEILHDLESGADFADSLARSAEKYYGTAFRAYISAIVDKRSEIAVQVKSTQKDFCTECVPEDASGQVSRVAARFALVAAGGELATQAGITGWPTGEAYRATMTCFKSWLDLRGGTGSSEDQKAWEQVTTFFQRFGQSRFAEWSSSGNEKIADRTGFIQRQDDETYFYVFPTIFKQEICKGYDSRKVLQLLANRELLVREGGKNTVSRKPPSQQSSVRFHCIKGDIIDA